MHTLALSALLVAPSSAVTIWTVGAVDDAQVFNAGNPGPGGGDINTRFVQEGGGVTALPGNSASPDGDQNSDDDYYLAGVYSSVVDGGTYTPVGTVAANENNAERAFLHNGAPTDTNLRYHFNFPATVAATDDISVTFGITNYEASNVVTNTWEVDVLVNGVLQSTVTIGNTDINGDFTTPNFSLADINTTAGAGPDNYVELVSRTSNNGGSRWLSLDYVQLDSVAAVPEPSSSGLLFLSLAALGFIRRRK